MPVRGVGERWIGNRRFEPLRCKVIHKPPTHLSGTTDHENAAAITGRLRRHPFLLLARQRRADESGEYLLGKIRVDPLGNRAIAPATQHGLLALEVACRAPVRELLCADLADDPLALRDQLDKTIIDGGQLVS